MEKCRFEHIQLYGFEKVGLKALLDSSQPDVLQAASVFQGHESMPDRAERNLYVHGNRPGRAEGALYVQPTCLDVQRIPCSIKLSRNSIY